MTVKSNIDSLVWRGELYLRLSHRLINPAGALPPKRFSQSFPERIPPIARRRLSMSIDAALPRRTIVRRTNLSPQVILAGAQAVSIADQIRAHRGAWRVTALIILVGLSKTQMYACIERGELRAIRVGTALRIDPEDAAIWWERQYTI